MGGYPETKISISPGAMIFSWCPVLSFFGGRKRMISSGVMSGRFISSIWVVTLLRTGDMRDPEKLNDAFRIVCVPVILLRSSAVSYWLGAKATRTWQLLTMLS